MVATVNVEIWKGGADTAPGTETNVDSLGPPNIRFHTADTPDAIDTTNPVPIPSSSFNYSYWVHVALQFGGTFTQLSNFRHYSDGTIGWTLGTNGELRRGNRDSGDDGCPKASYNLATGTIGTTGDSIEDVTNGHAYFNAQTTKTTNIQNDTSGSPATIDSSVYSSAGDTKAIVLQVKVATDATQGDQANETLTWLYDEI